MEKIIQMKIIRNSFIAVIVLGFSSCTTFLYLEKTLDPEIIPEKKQNVIAFINYFDYTQPVYVKSKNEVTFHAGVTGLRDGLTSTFSGDSSFSFLVADSLNKSVGLGQLTTLLPIDSIVAISSRFRADLILALDSLVIYIDWETIVEDNGDGSRSKTKNFYLYNTFFMSLYSSNGELINRSKVDKSILYKSRPTFSGLITIRPSLANAWKAVGKLAFNAGQEYADKFYPRVVQESRLIYSGKPFKESNYYMQQGKWNKAIELLEQIVESPDKKLAEKARQNLSVAREGAGQK
jgi:hypothetical protein